MNKILIVTVSLFLLMCNISIAQKDRKMDNLKSKKIAFITDELMLTPEQAEKFWPLYNAHSKNKKEDRFEKRSSEVDFNNMTDAEANELLNRMISNEESKLIQKKEFVDKLKSILDTKQIVLLFRAERKFKRELFKDYKKQIRVYKID